MKCFEGRLCGSGLVDVFRKKEGNGIRCGFCFGFEEVNKINKVC